jgi:TRAP-type uncharacterized transport system substrate-binding protein
MQKRPRAGQKTFPGIFNRRFLLIFSPVLLTAIFSIVIAYLLTPPDSLTMTTGFEGGTYAKFGERYKNILAREKVRLEILASSGSVENLKRLGDPALQADVGFVQDGTSSPAETKNLVSLGAVCYSPLWVFYRSPESIDDLSGLKGKRIAIGPEGSGARKFSLDLLKATGAADPPTSLLAIPSAAANKALLNGAVDAVVVIGTEDNSLVRELLYAPGIKLLSFRQAEAYTRLFPTLSHIILPEGILSLSEGIPSQDIHLVATTTSLVVRQSLHPALHYLLLDAAMEIHGSAGWLNKRGEFPSPKELDFPSSSFAERFYRKGRPFLLDYLPFWVAVLVDRLVIILVPVAFALIPLLRGIPWLYAWRNRRKFSRWYEELKSLESEMGKKPAGAAALEYRDRLDRIEAAINRLRVPLILFGEVNRLKEHVDGVRGKLARLNPNQEEKET